MHRYTSFGKCDPIVEDVKRIACEVSGIHSSKGKFFASADDTPYKDADFGSCFHFTLYTYVFGINVKLAEIYAVHCYTDKYPANNTQWNKSNNTIIKLSKIDNDFYLYKAVLVNKDLKNYIQSNQHKYYEIDLIKFFKNEGVIPVYNTQDAKDESDYAYEDPEDKSTQNAYMTNSRYPLWTRMNFVMQPKDYDGTLYSMDSPVGNVFTDKKILKVFEQKNIVTLDDVFICDVETIENLFSGSLLAEFYNELSATYN